MRPRLLFPYAQQRSVQSVGPLTEGLEGRSAFGYRIFPKMDPALCYRPRPTADYCQDAAFESFGSPISQDELSKMHDNEYARYMVEILHVMWFQIFCTTLPVYSAHAPVLVEFARRLLGHLRSKLKPMRDIEIIFRRMFEACGSCKQHGTLRDLFHEMKKAGVIPNKVTSGTYYQALLQSRRRGGQKEEDMYKRRSYFQRRIEDYQDKMATTEG
jgi:pentatricopeptide repeat protein